MAKKKKAEHQKVGGPVSRKDDYIYYVRRKGNYGEVWGSPKKGKRGKPYYTGVKVPWDNKYLYFVGGDGYVYRVRRRNA